MYHVSYPPDPDCEKCGGRGTIFRRSEDGPFMNSLSVGPCNCGKPENVAKVQARCQHEFVCKRCGKVEE